MIPLQGTSTATIFSLVPRHGSDISSKDGTDQTGQESHKLILPAQVTMDSFELQQSPHASGTALAAHNTEEGRASPTSFCESSLSFFD